LSEKWQSATAQQYIYPKDIKNFKIPLLPKPTQQKIADLVQKSYQARKKAKELLEEVKRKVEELIEIKIKISFCPPLASWQLKFSIRIFLKLK